MKESLTSPTGIKRELTDGNAVCVASKRTKLTSPPTQHPTFWDSGGDVIIQIETTLFKLQRTSLIRQSEYFHRLLQHDEVKGVPKQDDIDVLPIYRVSKTNVHDFEALLTAMDSAVLVNYLLECPTFEVVASILRVSTVLDFPKLREYAVHCLKDAWPDQLEEFSVSSKWLEYSAAAVQLAKDCDVPDIRKRALYELVRRPGFPENATNTLSKSDISLLCRAKENVGDEWWNVMLKEKRVACVQKRPQGGTSLACLGFPPMRSTLPRNAEFLIQRAKDPISGFQEAIEAPWRPVCQSCVEAKRADWRKQRLKFWSKLDEWFELNETTSGV